MAVRACKHLLARGERGNLFCLYPMPCQLHRGLSNALLLVTAAATLVTCRVSSRTLCCATSARQLRDLELWSMHYERFHHTAWNSKSGTVMKLIWYAEGLD